MITREELIERLKKGSPYKAELEEAIEQESRICLHAKTSVRKPGNLPGYLSFTRFVKGLLRSSKKLKRFESFIRTPFVTNGLVDLIFTFLSRVFDSSNSSEYLEFKSPDQFDRFTYFWNEQKYGKKLKLKGHEIAKERINSLLVVDMPETGGDPYFYFLDVDQVKDLEMDEYGAIQWICFESPEGVALFDKESYRVYEKDDEAGEILGPEIINSRHGLGWCPVRWFWSDNLSTESLIVKKSPISQEIEKFDWLAFMEYSKKHVDLYVPFPIISYYRKKCNHKNQHGEMCDGGLMRDKNGHFIMRDGGTEYMECPKCNGGGFAGAGTQIKLPIPTGGQPDLKNPVTITSVDTNGLDYLVRESERLENSILRKTVGSTGDVLRKQSINKDQVKSFFESMRQPLFRYKKNFEAAHEWLIKTVAGLAGYDLTACSVNYGTEFYLISADDIQEMYLDARDKQADPGTLDYLQELYYQTVYKYDPEALQRQMIILDLMPMRHAKPSEVMDYVRAGMISKELGALQINLSAFVDRFERDQAPIIQFGANMKDRPEEMKLAYASRIDQIKEILLGYVQEQIGAEATPGESGGINNQNTLSDD